MPDPVSWLWLNHFFAAGDDEGSRDTDRVQDHLPSSGTGGSLSFRDEKQEPVVVRPYPQVQSMGQPAILPQHVPIQPSPPISVPGPPVHLPQGQPPTFPDGHVKVSVSPNPQTSITNWSCAWCSWSWSISVLNAKVERFSYVSLDAVNPIVDYYIVSNSFFLFWCLGVCRRAYVVLLLAC